MAKDPAFLFYPGDWQGGTSTFTRFLKGCYMDVLIAQFNNGNLSLEEIKTVLGSDFGQSWPTLQKKFKQDGNGLYFNEKLQTEIIKRKEYSLSRSKNRLSEGKKDMKDISKSHEQSYVKHMENENENRNIIEVKKGGAGGKIKQFDLYFISPLIQPVYEKFIGMRKEIKKPFSSQISLEANYTQLMKLAKGDIPTAIEILNNSIANQWQGLFELKSQSPKVDHNPHKLNKQNYGSKL